MKFAATLFLFFFGSVLAFPQVDMQRDGMRSANNSQQQQQQQQDEFNDKDVIFDGEKPPVTDYRIISFERDTTYLDTTLHINKDYRFNYLRKDELELLPFANVGQTYNSLAYDYSGVRLKPQFGARARHFNYMEAEDISYYHVPTPLTELYFKTAFEQGQQLDAFFTINTSEQFNFSVAYKGLRSLGNYQNALTSTGNFRFTTNYHTKNKRYNIRAHVVFQDLMNRENGGVKDDFILFFMNDDDDFRDRGRLEVKFEDAESILEGRRFFMQHEYAFINHRDSVSYTSLKIGQTVSFENKYFQYTQAAPFAEYGPSYVTGNLRDRVKLEDFYTNVYADFDNNLLGNITFFAGFTNFNYGYKTILYLDEGTITNRLKGNLIEAGASYRKHYRGFELFGKGAVNVSGDFEGNYLLGQASYEFDENNRVRALAHINSVAPNYNFLLYQSDYINYNWQRAFRNEKKQHLQFDLESDTFFNAAVSYTGIDDYAYFAKSGSTNTTQPFQYEGRVDYLKIQLNREFRYGKFAWNNTFLYQNVLNGSEVFKVPEFLGRSSIYFSDHLFKKALFLQTGITARYFTKYHLNAYDPVLAEFYVQNEQEFGDFPLVDFFLNAKISQTRIYFKLEHFNSLFGDKNYFSAPNYPYRDFSIRFGLVWNFFM